MTIELNVTADIKQVTKFLTDLERKKLPNMIARTINSTTKQARALAAKELKKEFGRSLVLKSSGFAKAIQLIRATKTNLIGTLIPSGRAIPMIEFGARPAGGGVSAAPLGKRSIYKGAFIQTMRSGHRGVFRRKQSAASSSGKRKGRLPVREMWGPSLPSIFLKGKLLNTLRRAATQRWQINFTREFDRLIRQR